MSVDDLYNNLKVYEPKVKGMSSTHGVTPASTQVNAAYSTNIDNLSDDIICSFFASQPNSPQHAPEDLQQIHPDDIEEMDLRWQMAMLTMRARRFFENKDPSAPQPNNKGKDVLDLKEINVVSLKNSFDALMEKDKKFEVNNETLKASDVSLCRFWASAMKLDIQTKNKMGFITGSCVKSDYAASNLLSDQWDRCNAVVLPWILGSLSQDVYLGHVFSYNAAVV
ncbi:hypothetical protein Tco_0163228 [Tanacetum coccineum]